MAGDSKIIGGLMGFSVVIQGILPPELQAQGEDMIRGWVTANVTASLALMSAAKSATVTLVPLDSQGRPLPQGPKLKV